MLIRQRKALKHKEARSFLQEFSREYGLNEKFPEKELKIETTEVGGVELIFLNGKPSLLRVGARLFPTLTFNEVLERLPKVIVDMGAIQHICNGADIMAPGVRRIEGDFPRGSVVVVTEERFGKYLAVGEAIENSDQMKRTKQGKIVVNKHYVGDEVWNAISKMVA